MSNKKLNLDCSHYYQSLIIDLILKLPLHQEIIALAYIASQRNPTHNLKPCSLHIKTKCYLGIVRLIIEYACTVWAPHTAQDINRIEIIQGRAARFV